MCVGTSFPLQCFKLMIFTVKRSDNSFLSAMHWIAGCRVGFCVHNMPASNIGVSAVSHPFRLGDAIKQHLFELARNANHVLKHTSPSLHESVFQVFEEIAFNDWNALEKHLFS